jgi:hypothetical protein
MAPVPATLFNPVGTPDPKEGKKLHYSGNECGDLLGVRACVRFQS